MNVRMNLLGKTISGVVAVRDEEAGPAQIWMLQFTDGSHVEFVSPAAKKRLRMTAARAGSRPVKAIPEQQLALNVA